MAQASKVVLYYKSFKWQSHFKTLPPPGTPRHSREITASLVEASQTGIWLVRMPGNIFLVLFFTKSFLSFKSPYSKDKDMGGDLKQLKITQDSTAFSVGHLLILLLPYSHMPTVTLAFSLITPKKKYLSATTSSFQSASDFHCSHSHES